MVWIDWKNRRFLLAIYAHVRMRLKNEEPRTYTDSLLGPEFFHHKNPSKRIEMQFFILI